MRMLVAALAMVAIGSQASAQTSSTFWSSYHTPHAQEVIPYSDNAPNHGGGFIQKPDTSTLVRPMNEPNPHVDQYFRTSPGVQRQAVLCFGPWFCRPKNR